jgi:hypothetical protein
MGVETALIVAATVGAGASVMSGMQQREISKGQAKQAEADANAAKGEAQVRADMIRKNTQQKAASARAAIAAGGGSLDSATASLINTDIVKRGEMDALTGVNDGMDTASRLRAQASSLRTAGNQAAVAGVVNAGTTALSTYAGYQAGWYGNQKTKVAA